MAPIYDMIPMPEDPTLPKSLDEAAIFYDMRVRNNKVLRGGKQNQSSDSFDW